MAFVVQQSDVSAGASRMCHGGNPSRVASWLGLDDDSSRSDSFFRHTYRPETSGDPECSLIGDDELSFSERSCSYQPLRATPSSTSVRSVSTRATAPHYRECGIQTETFVQPPSYQTQHAQVYAKNISEQHKETKVMSCGSFQQRPRIPPRSERSYAVCTHCGNRLLSCFCNDGLCGRCISGSHRQALCLNQYGY